MKDMYKTRIRYLGWEYLEKEMVTHSSILAWRISWKEKLRGLQSMGLQRSEITEVTQQSTKYVVLLEHY